MAMKNMKVCRQNGYKYKTVSTITLKVKWLEGTCEHNAYKSSG